MGEFAFLEKLYTFAKENGYKVEDLNVGDRRSKRGYYKYVTLALIIPGKENEDTQDAHETTENKTISAQAQKEEVINHEI